MSSIQTLTVDADAHGQRLDKWLAGASGLSRARGQALIAAGHVHADGVACADGAAKVQAGQVYVLHVPAPVSAAPVPQDIPLDILFEDAHLIVLNKPAGISMHPGAGQPDGTLVNALLHHCAGSLSGIGGVERPGIVHRLDQDTSGVVVCAKTDLAHQHLSQQFEARSTDRQYIALTRNAPWPAEGRIETHIARSKYDRQKMAVVKPPKAQWAPIHGQGLRDDKTTGRHAITNYRVVEVYGAGEQVAAAMVACKLETGRTHQIRVHLAHIGCPVLGDPVYGSGAPVKAVQQILSDAGFHRQALHAATLGFVHPHTGKHLKFKSDMPGDMQELIEHLTSL